VTKNRDSIEQKVEEFIERYEEAKSIIEKYRGCGDIRCRLKVARAVIELYKMVDRFIYQLAFIASGNENGELVKAFEDLILEIARDLEGVGVHVDMQKWAKALSDTSRYRSRVLDGIRSGDVRKENDTKYI